MVSPGIGYPGKKSRTLTLNSCGRGEPRCAPRCIMLREASAPTLARAGISRVSSTESGRSSGTTKHGSVVDHGLEEEAEQMDDGGALSAWAQNGSSNMVTSQVLCGMINGLASLVLLLSAMPGALANHYDGRGRAIFAFLGGLLGLCLAVAFLSFRSPRCGKMSSGSLTVLIMLLTWLPITFIVTFFGPFVNVGNGYFASWGGLLSAAYLVHETPPMSDAVGRGINITRLALLQASSQDTMPRHGLLAASCVLFLACVRPITLGIFVAPCIVAVIVTILSAVALLLPPKLLHPPRLMDGEDSATQSRSRRIVSLVLAFGWSILCSWLTFETPFGGSGGNGFFSCWAGLLGSLVVMWQEW